MKRFLILLLVLLMITGCSKEETVNYTYEIVSHDVDMSKYEGVNSTKHNFKRANVQELFNCIDNKSSAIFYLGRTNCQCCQQCAKYINQAAMDLGVTIYYLDVYDPEMPLTDQDLCDKLKEYIYDILDVVDGVKELQTPTLFTVINGKPTDSMICFGKLSMDNPPTDKQYEKLVNRYKEILKPFVE